MSNWRFFCFWLWLNTTIANDARKPIIDHCRAIIIHFPLIFLTGFKTERTKENNEWQINGRRQIDLYNSLLKPGCNPSATFEWLLQRRRLVTHQLWISIRSMCWCTTSSALEFGAVLFDTTLEFQMELAGSKMEMCRVYLLSCPFQLWLIIERHLSSGISASAFQRYCWHSIQ